MPASTSSGRDILGQAPVQKTEKYLRATAEQTRAAVRAAYPSLVEAKQQEVGLPAAQAVRALGKGVRGRGRFARGGVTP